MNLAIKILNKLLPIGRKLADNATDDDIAAAAEFVEQHQTTRAMLAAEGKSTHTTRPRIALGAFRVVAFAVLACVSAWIYGVLVGDVELVAALAAGWPFLLAILGPLTSLLLAYFGILRGEQADRLGAATGATVKSGVISGIIKAVAGKN